MKINNLLNNGNQKNKRFIKTLITILLTLPIAFLMGVLSLSLLGNPYSLRDVIFLTSILAIILFWIILLIVNRYLKSRSFLEAEEPKGSIFNKSLLYLLIPTILFIYVFTWTLLSVEDIQGINYFPPNYRYQVEIFPTSNNTGEICIDEIKNSRGDIFVFNKGIQGVQTTGNWEKDIDGCLFFLETGDQGVINIDYVGAIDDTLRFDFKVGLGGGIVNISSNPGRTIKLDLSSEKNSLRSIKFRLGSHLIRNFTDWGILAGLFSAAIIFLIIIYLIETRWAEKTSGKPVSTTTPIKKFKLILSQPISEKSAIFVLFIIYFIGVIFTMVLTRPLASGPSHFGDEIIYWETAVALYDGSYSPSQFVKAPPFYPTSILPAFYLFYPENAYLGAKILNALYFTSAIFPAYLLLRIFLERKKSILVALLFLINPAQIIFPPRILSENLFFPMLLWAILLGFKNFDSPNKRKIFLNIFFGILISFLFLTRRIGLVLIPAFFIIWWLKQENGSDLYSYTFFKNKIKPFIWVLIPMGVILGTWVVWGLTDGLSFMEALGFFSGVEAYPEQLTIYRLLMWGVFYISYSILLAGPFLPMILSSVLDFKNIDTDRKRWVTTLSLVVIFMLIACIRHSWMQTHNFPVPNILQGRYIFFFNHLFLVTAAISLTNEQNFLKRIRIFIYSGLLVTLAYAIMQIGFIFINHPLRVSISSPYGRFMDAYGPGFLAFSLIFILLFSSLPFLKKSLSKSILFLFILGFYIVGGIKVYNIEVSKVSQLYNSQIFYLLKNVITQCDDYSKESNHIIEIYYPEGAEDWKLRYWSETLKFYGFTNAKLYEEKIYDNSSDNVFRAEYGGCRINLRNINQELFQMSNNLKFSYGDEYFEYLIEP